MRRQPVLLLLAASGFGAAALFLAGGGLVESATPERPFSARAALLSRDIGPPGVPTAAPAFTATPTRAPSPTPTPAPTAATPQLVSDPHDLYQVNDITEIWVAPTADAIRFRIVSGEFFSFSEEWTGDASYVHLMLALNTGQQLLIAIDDGSARIYDTTAGFTGWITLGQVGITHSSTPGTKWPVPYLYNVMEFTIPSSYLSGATSASLSATGAWARDSPTCSSSYCSWYTYDRVAPTDIRFG